MLGFIAVPLILHMDIYLDMVGAGEAMLKKVFGILVLLCGAQNLIFIQKPDDLRGAHERANSLLDLLTKKDRIVDIIAGEGGHQCGGEGGGTMGV